MISFLDLCYPSLDAGLKNALRHGGNTNLICDVLRGNYRGLVLTAIQSGDSVFLHMQIFDLTSAKKKKSEYPTKCVNTFDRTKPHVAAGK